MTENKNKFGLKNFDMSKMMKIVTLAFSTSKMEFLLLKKMENFTFRMKIVFDLNKNKLKILVAD